MKKWKKVLIIVGVLCVAGYFTFVGIVNAKYSNAADASLLGASQDPLLAALPQPHDWKVQRIDQLPPAVEDEIDLRHMDLSHANLLLDEETQKKITFDTATVWPEATEGGFDPDVAIENGKNPGLGIRAIHKTGITGKGVGIAIIDMPLLLSHEQYAGQVRFYEEYKVISKDTSMHGAAVASAAVGADTGVAPGAALYFIGTEVGTYFPPFGALRDFNRIADCVERLLEINAYLPEKEKIRVISVSVGFSDTREIGGRRLKETIDTAAEQGVFVLTTTPEHNFGFTFMGLGKDWDTNPDIPQSYRAGSWWEREWYESGTPATHENELLVPMDARTLAGFTGDAEYVYYAEGGLSWSVPWLAGMYALCVQADPDITPDVFISKAIETSTTVHVVHEGMEYTLSGVIDPAALIEAVMD